MKFFGFPYPAFPLIFHRSCFKPSALSSSIQFCHIPFHTNSTDDLPPYLSEKIEVIRQNPQFSAILCHLSYSHTYLSLLFLFFLCVMKELFFFLRRIFPSVFWIPLSPTTFEVTSIPLNADVNEHLFRNCSLRY